MSEHIYKRDDDVIWEESRTWGGKQNTPAKFIRYAGDKSALIGLAVGAAIALSTHRRQI